MTEMPPRPPDLPPPAPPEPPPSPAYELWDNHMDNLNLETRAMLLQERAIVVGQGNLEGAAQIDQAIANVEALIPPEKLDALVEPVLQDNREYFVEHLDLMLEKQDFAAAAADVQNIRNIDLIRAGQDPYVPLQVADAPELDSGQPPDSVTPPDTTGRSAPAETADQTEVADGAGATTDRADTEAVSEFDQAAEAQLELELQHAYESGDLREIARLERALSEYRAR